MVLFISVNVLLSVWKVIVSGVKPCDWMSSRTVWRWKCWPALEGEANPKDFLVTGHLKALMNRVEVFQKSLRPAIEKMTGPLSAKTVKKEKCPPQALNFETKYGGL